MHVNEVLVRMVVTLWEVRMIELHPVSIDTLQVWIQHLCALLCHCRDSKHCKWMHEDGPILAQYMVLQACVQNSAVAGAKAFSARKGMLKVEKLRKTRFNFNLYIHQMLSFELKSITACIRQEILMFILITFGVLKNASFLLCS